MKNASKAVTSIQAKALCVVAKAETRRKASAAPKPGAKAASKAVHGPSTAPEAMKLMQVPGVGSMTALSFALSLGAPERFRDSRDVGAFLGMTPKRRQSGERDPQLGITKEP